MAPEIKPGPTIDKKSQMRMLVQLRKIFLWARTIPSISRLLRLALYVAYPESFFSSNTLSFLLIELGFVQEINGEPLTSEKAGFSISK